MTKSPWRIDVQGAVTEECLPDGFASLDVYIDYCNVLNRLIVALAVDAHPSWESVGDDSFIRRGKTGPKTVQELQEWFEKNHRQRLNIMADALRQAVHEKRGLVPPDSS